MPVFPFDYNTSYFPYGLSDEDVVALRDIFLLYAEDLPLPPVSMESSVFVGCTLVLQANLNVSPFLFLQFRLFSQ